MKRRALIFSLSFIAIWVLSITPARALPNDINLHFLFNGRDLQNPANNRKLRENRQSAFSFLATEFGFALAEPILSPAETLGISGFDFGIEMSLADIPETSPHWRNAVEDYRPDNQLFLTRLRFRKGLFFSLELEGTLGFIYNSSSVLGGVGLKWALQDGYFYIPDLAVRASINRLFASRDLDIFNVTVDVWISNQFPIVGSMTITPYVGYSMLYTYANSRVLDPTPLNFNDNEDGASGSRNFVFSAEHIFGSRISFGMRIVWFFLSFTLEGSVAIPHFEGPSNIWNFNGKFSFFF